MAIDQTQIILSIGIGILAAFVYTLRVLIIIDKKLAKIMKHQGISENTI